METTVSPTAYQSSPPLAFAFQPHAFVWDFGMADSNRLLPSQSTRLRGGPGVIQTPQMPGTTTHNASPVVNSASHQPSVFTFTACPQELAGKHPLSWSKDDVEDWLKWCVQEFSLGGVEPRRFSMNGKALCILAKEGFQHRAPYAGDVLHDLLQMLRKGGIHICQSVPGMQMKSTSSANEAITLARHLCSSSTAINGKDVDSTPRCTVSPSSKTASSHKADRQYKTHSVNRNYHEAVEEETMPLNLKITEATCESSSDSGISTGNFQELAEERESHPAHPLSAVNVYACMPDRPDVSRPTWLLPDHRSSTREDRSKSSSPAGAQVRRSCLTARSHHGLQPCIGYPTTDTVFSTHPTSDTVSKTLHVSHIQSPALPGQADYRNGRARWNRHPDMSNLANYKINKEGDIEAARRRQEEKYIWKENHPSLKEERDQSPVRSRMQVEEGKLFNTSPDIPSPRHSTIGNHSHRNHSNGQMMLSACEVPVIRAIDKFRRRSPDTAASQTTAAVRTESVPQPAPLQPLADVVELNNPHARQSPKRQRNCREFSFPKVQSAFFNLQSRKDLVISSRMNKPKQEECSGKQKGECRLLWDFLAQVLADEKYTPYIRWEEEAQLVFRIVDPTALATMWGRQKNRDDMTYEKLSRSLRYYYNTNIITKVPGQKLTYRFMQHPKDIANAPRFSKAKKLKAATQGGALTSSGASSREGSVTPESDHSDSTDYGSESSFSEPTVVAMPTNAVETDFLQQEAMEISIKEEPVKTSN